MDPKLSLWRENIFEQEEIMPLPSDQSLPTFPLNQSPEDQSLPSLPATVFFTLKSAFFTFFSIKSLSHKNALKLYLHQNPVAQN